MKTETPTTLPPYPQEFVKFMRQLDDMRRWFSKYHEAYVERNDGELTAYGNLSDALTECANAISDLAANEFIDSYFFKEGKEEAVKTLKIA